MITTKDETMRKEPSKRTVKRALVNQSSTVSVPGDASTSSPQSKKREPQEEQRGREPSKRTVKRALVSQSSTVSVQDDPSTSSPQSKKREPQEEQVRSQPTSRVAKVEETWWQKDVKLILILIVVVVVIVLGEQFHDDRLITAAVQGLYIIIQFVIAGRLLMASKLLKE